MMYMICTYFVYKWKYDDFHKHVEKYEEDLQTLHRMYEKEEKIKA